MAMLNRPYGSFHKEMNKHWKAIFGSYSFERQFLMKLELPRNVSKIKFNYNFTISDNNGVSVNIKEIGEFPGFWCTWDHSAFVDSKELKIRVEMEIMEIVDDRIGKLEKICWSQYGFV